MEKPSFTPPAELRRPPANVQKSRRRCIDFGLGRAPSTTQISSSPLSHHVLTSASPQLTTHAGTGRESETSSLSDNLDMVFPQPPPMILRRAHSSPLLSAKGTCVARSTIDICGDRKLHDYASEKHSSWSVLHNAASAGHWTSVGPSDLLEQLELELEAEALLSSKAPPVVSHVHNHPLAARASESYNHGRRTDHASMAVSVSGLQKSLSVPSASQRKERHNTTLCVSKYAHTGIIPGPSVVTDKTKTLSPARSTSSLSSAIAHIVQREKTATSTTPGPTRNGLSKARSAIPVASLDHPAVCQENQRTSHPQGLHCPTSNNPGTRNHQVKVTYFSLFPSFALLTCVDRQKMSKRTHLSSLFTVFGSPKDSLGHLKSLGSPFHHRLTRDQSGVHVSTRAPPYVPKSFIDITPEQDISDSRGTRRNLTRKLLVKAGRGILGWGRGTRQETKHV
jgi:hypothetical protein